MDEPPDWNEPTEITPIQVVGEIIFSCCHQTQTRAGPGLTGVRCQRCGTEYGLALLARIQPVQQGVWPRGTAVRVRSQVVARAGSTAVVLEPARVYRTAVDTYGVLNVPPAHTLITVEVVGEQGQPRPLVAVVADDLLESATGDLLIAEE